MHCAEPILRTNAADATDTANASSPLDAFDACSSPTPVALAHRLMEMQRRNEELESFIRALAHDAGALTRGIGLRAQMLRERLHEPAAGAGDILDAIEDRANRLGRMSEGLLRLARIGACELQYDDIDLSALAGEVLEGLRRDEPGRAIACTVQPALRLRGDPVLVRLALDNLLGNAWKYTALASAPRIEFGRRVSTGEHVYFVTDNGIGLPPGMAGRLFSPFVRLAPAHSFQGHGLGLATVKRIVERHGGWIRAEGHDATGTAFVFSFGPDTVPTQKAPSAA